ncbi:hypothetical protein [Lysobacter gummosus]
MPVAAVMPRRERSRSRRCRFTHYLRTNARCVHRSTRASRLR